MDLYNLGPVPWPESQLIYHALAELGREALVLLSPASPYVCIGCHQDAGEEVDLNFCQTHDLPVFRRKVGGGAVYLDGSQLFFQLILRADNPLIPPKKEAFYRKFLIPIVETYREIGLPAEYKPINDVLVNGRKISGTGVGEIGGCLVFVGNLILDFDFNTMARVLKIPDEKFRDKVHKAMTENMTTIRRELGETQAARWNESALNDIMTRRFEQILGPLAPGTVDDELQAGMADIGAVMMTSDWLFEPGRKRAGREIKIRAGLKLTHKTHKAPGGLIRAAFALRDDCFQDVSISGDFFCYPPDAVAVLEKLLENTHVRDATQTIAGFYQNSAVETAGITVEDWLEVLKV